MLTSHWSGDWKETGPSNVQSWTKERYGKKHEQENKLTFSPLKFQLSHENILISAFHPRVEGGTSRTFAPQQ